MRVVATTRANVFSVVQSLYTDYVHTGQAAAGGTGLGDSQVTKENNRRITLVGYTNDNRIMNFMSF